MNTYELSYIIPIKTDGEDISSIQARIDDILAKNAATKSSIQNEFTSPQKKKLSYEIDKYQYGYYVTLYFDAESQAIENISKELKEYSGILRFLIVSIKGEVPQGVAVSKKEVEQQVDEVVESITKEAESADGSQEQENIDGGGADQKETEPAKDAEEKKAKKSKEAKESKKTSLENLDEKLDEILGE